MGFALSKQLGPEDQHPIGTSVLLRRHARDVLVVQRIYRLEPELKPFGGQVRSQALGRAQTFEQQRKESFGLAAKHGPLPPLWPRMRRSIGSP